jgi:hypothetical protein
MRVADRKYQWVELFRDSQRDDRGRFYGHSFWRDEVSGRVSVKDMSGDYPDETDDGPLWIDLDRPVQFHFEDRLGTADVGRATIPVIAERDTRSYVVGVLWRDAVEVCRRLKLRAVVDRKVHDLLRLLVDVCLVQSETEATS